MSLTEEPAVNVVSISESVNRLAQAIFAADDISSTEIEVPEWGVTLELRSPDALRRAALVKGMIPDDWDPNSSTPPRPDMARMYTSVIIATAYDPETGEPVFTEADAVFLGQKNGVVVERVGAEAMKVAGLNAEAVEEGKLDSSTTPSDATPTT